MKKKLIRITTVPGSMGGLLRGQLKFMSQYYDILGVSSMGPQNFLEKVGEDQGVEIYPVEMTRQITLVKDLKAVWKLYKLFRREKPFIVHTHTPKAGTLGMFAAKLAGVPHRLHTIAGLPLVEATGFKRFVLNTVERITYSCATKVYPNSYGLIDIVLENRFAKREKLKVIANGSSNGINTQHFDPSIYNQDTNNELREKYKIPLTNFVFVFAGRMVKDKGINELVSAFIKLNKQYTNTTLLLVGDMEKTLDPLLPETEHQMETNKNIVLTGWQTDVRPFYAISNALAFPSYREGFPNVVMQASAMGMPSIVSDINGCNEIIEHYKNGVIIPTKDEEALFEAMKYLLDNPTETSKMAANSRENIVANYEQEVVWNALLEEYKQLS